MLTRDSRETTLDRAARDPAFLKALIEELEAEVATAIKPIKTDTDHEAALAEIERLWGAVPGTPEHDRLEVLGVLVNHYEEKRWPIDLYSEETGYGFGHIESQ